MLSGTTVHGKNFGLAFGELFGLVVFLALLASLVCLHFEVLTSGTSFNSIKELTIPLSCCLSQHG